MIDSNTVQRIVETAQISEVIGDFISLKKRGVNMIGVCPFHNEKTPSFTVSPAKGIFKCFGCGKGGNSVNFVMEHEHVSYPEALKYLAKKYHIEVQEKEETPEDIMQRNERESMLIVSSFAEKYFHENLQSAEGKAIGLSYFKEREIRPDIIDKFKLGYSPEDRKALTAHALTKGYKQEFLEKTGLSIFKDKTYYFDRFHSRVIFPIHNLSGKAIAFGGRTLSSEKKIAKYLNSPESEIYHKSYVLYGLYQAKNAIVKSDMCYMVEGYTDVLSMHMVGVENTVASSGTSLTVDQIRLVKRFTKNLTILYDGDAAGIKASLRGIDLVIEQGLNVKIVLLPEGEDPDSYSKALKKDEFTKFLTENETDFISFKARLLLKESKNDLAQKARLINDIVLTISKINDEVARSLYIQECSTILGVDENVLLSKLSGILRQGSPQKQNTRQRYAPPPPPGPPPMPPGEEQQGGQDRIWLLEREIVRVMINYGSESISKETPDLVVAQYIIDELQRDEILFTSALYTSFFKMYKQQLEEKNENIQKFFVNHPEQEISSKAADLISSNYKMSKFWEKGDDFIVINEITLETSVPKLVHDYKFEKVHTMLAELKKKLTDTSIPFEEVMVILGQIKAYQGIMSVLSKELGGRIIGLQ